MARRNEEHELDTFEDTFDFGEVLEKDEREVRYERVLKHRRKLKVRKKRMKYIILILLVFLIGGYFLTSISNIRVLKVKNNVVYDQSQILKKAGLSYGNKLVFHPNFSIERALKSDPLIESVSVQKNYLSGAIYIDVKEAKIVGNYEEAGKKYLLLANGENIEMGDARIPLLNTPYLSGFSKEQLKALGKAFQKIDEENIVLISEIRRLERSYDANMLELLMNDGYKVRTDYESLKMLSSYKRILKKTKGTNRCIEFTEENDAAYTENCE